MEKEIIKKEFERVKNMGWIKTKKRGYGEAGMLFEELIGLKNNKMPFPDFYGIEIKTKYSTQIKEITLFNFSPKKYGLNSIRYLLENYGYANDGNNNYKNLNVSLYNGKKSKIGKYSIGLTMDLSNVYVTIYNKNGKIIDKSVYWEIEEIREKFEEKCMLIAYIIVKRYFKNGIVFYKYLNMEIYQYVSFEQIIKGIKDGRIFIDLKITTIKTGDRKGEVRNHGTAFRIMEKDLENIFIKR